MFVEHHQKVFEQRFGASNVANITRDILSVTECQMMESSLTQMGDSVLGEHYWNPPYH